MSKKIFRETEGVRSVSYDYISSNESYDTYIVMQWRPLNIVTLQILVSRFFHYFCHALERHALGSCRLRRERGQGHGPCQLAGNGDEGTCI